MSSSPVEVHVPASTANLGAGLDTLGLALDLHNRYLIALGESGPDIVIEGEGAGCLPTDERHPAYQACMNWLTRQGCRPAGLVIRQHNEIPYSGGLGNSATAVVAGVMAAGLLAGTAFTPDEVLQAASAIEGHPDNVAPAIYGGLVVCAASEVGRVVAARVPVPPGLWAVLAVPAFTLSTERSRQALPASVSLKDALFNVARSSLFVAALAAGQPALLAEAMDDRLHQPYRAKLVPGLAAVRRAALQAGALGAALSGSGPTMIALCAKDQTDPDRVGQAMVAAFAAEGVSARAMTVGVGREGATARRAIQLAEREARERL